MSMLLPFSYSKMREHSRAVSSSCFIVDSHGTGTFGSALPFRSHINSPGILRPAVATLQDGQLMPREAGEAVLLRTTANSRPRSNLSPLPAHKPDIDRCDC